MRSKSSVHQVRALHRGLRILEALNEAQHQAGGALVSEVAAATGLPRTTTFRLLENLRAAGYVDRDRTERRYFVTPRVQHLGSAFREEAWIREVAGPILDRLAARVHWPVYLLTLFGSVLLIRATTTFASPLASDLLAPGTRVPLLQSAGGKAWLAHCSAAERASLLAILAAPGDSGDGQGVDGEGWAPARLPPDLAATLRSIRRRGYAVEERAAMKKNPGHTTSIAVPLASGQRVYAVLTLRYTAAAMPLDRAVRRFVPILKATAREILAEAGL
jgi:IclR family mhp operon transcriptional activator